MDLLRQTDLINLEALKNLRVLIVGAGGIGSFTTTMLAKMGVENIQVWDKDVLESHNMANQNYYISQLEVEKVKALRDVVYDFSGTLIDPQNDFWFDNLDFNPDIIITGVDSMDSRQRIWDKISLLGPKIEGKILLDARMSSRAAQLFVVKFFDYDSIEHYKQTLYSDEEAVQEPCTAKAIIHTAYAISYMIGNVVHNIINRENVHYMYNGTLKEMRFSKSQQTITL